MEDEFGIAADDWVSLQGQKVDALRRLEDTLSERVRKVALQKIERTRSNLTTSLSLASGVLVTSILLAMLIARGVTRSVSSLSGAAGRVRKDQDFSIRAVKVSQDELGILTDAFNEMLIGIATASSRRIGTTWKASWKRAPPSCVRATTLCSWFSTT
jgi:methyl-accepting chemotaxis protein